MLRLALIALASLVPAVALAQSTGPRPTPSPIVRTTPGPAAGGIARPGVLPGPTGPGASALRSTTLQPPPAGALRSGIQSRLSGPGSASSALPPSPTQDGERGASLGVTQPAPGVPLTPPGVPLLAPGLDTNAPGPTGTGGTTSSLPGIGSGLGTGLGTGLGPGLGSGSAITTPVPTTPPTR